MSRPKCNKRKQHSNRRKCPKRKNQKKIVQKRLHRLNEAVADRCEAEVAIEVSNDQDVLEAELAADVPLRDLDGHLINVLIRIVVERQHSGLHSIIKIAMNDQALANGVVLIRLTNRVHLDLVHPRRLRPLQRHVKTLRSAHVAILQIV